ncbi:hypothetical protein BSKO_03594 [Bryopsis sp. KO-2023]|nr:hypothetical protein BSKO_03594 [Bryopsis sp. KO-2023]
MEESNQSERADFRSASELRAVACERSLLTQAHGSVRWSQGQSTVMVAVFGPVGTSDTHAAQKGIVEVLFKGRQSAGHRERDLEFKLQESMRSSILLNLIPRTVIRIVIQVLQDDGSLLACAFNACCAALVDAGVPLKNMWVSVACVIASGGEILVDPDESEERNSEAIVCATFPSIRQQHDSGWTTSIDSDPMFCDSCGHLEMDTFFQMVEICRRGGSHVADFNMVSLGKRLELTE